VVKASNDDHDALVAALRGQDALLITLSVLAPEGTQLKLIRAAAEAGVPWVLPNDWGCDTANSEVVNDIPGISKTPQGRKDIAATGVSSYLSVTTGFWYEWSLAIPPSYGSTWPQVGRAVAALLSLPIKPEGDDTERCLEHFRNKIVYVNSFNASQKDMLDSVLRVTGDKLEDWTIQKEPARERYATAAKALQGGDRMAYVRMMYTRVFFDDGNGNFEAREGTANKILGLSEESIDEATTRSIERAEASPWASSKLVEGRKEQAAKGIAL
jgi:hypothetical protein